MGYIFAEESFASLSSYWTDSKHNLIWNSVFVLPVWLKAWCQEFGSGAELYLRTVRQGEQIIGVAPLLIKDSTVTFIGSVDVCDYLDFVTLPGRENDFFKGLLDDLGQKGINSLDLRALRTDSIALTYLTGVAKSRNYEVSCQQEDVSLEMDLPASWEGYLALLDSKQRHEVKRKLRRLSEAGKIDYRWIQPGQLQVKDLMDNFMRLFLLSREEKACFMTARMESFFRSVAEAMAEVGLLRFGILELDSIPAAMIMCFDYSNTMYLYNSGYDPEYSSLSVGLLSKVLGVKESIRQGRGKWDFLKGGEAYKYQLGGKEVPIYNCKIEIR